MRTFDQSLGSFGFRAGGGFVGAFRDDGICTFPFDGTFTKYPSTPAVNVPSVCPANIGDGAVMYADPQ